MATWTKTAMRSVGRTVHDEHEQRGCRYHLRGVEVSHGGERWYVDSTRWGPDELVVSLTKIHPLERDRRNGLDDLVCMADIEDLADPTLPPVVTVDPRDCVILTPWPTNSRERGKCLCGTYNRLRKKAESKSATRDDELLQLSSPKRHNQEQQA